MLEHVIYGCIVTIGLLLSTFAQSFFSFVLIGAMCSLLIVFCAEVLFV